MVLLKSPSSKGCQVFVDKVVMEQNHFRLPLLNLYQQTIVGLVVWEYGLRLLNEFLLMHGYVSSVLVSFYMNA